MKGLITPDKRPIWFCPTTSFSFFVWWSNYFYAQSHSATSPFGDFSGHPFERLVFAYLLRTDNWLSLDWYGQTGGDSGRDIGGVRERDGYPQGQKVCIQCANRRSLSQKKVREDFHKIISGPNGIPDVFLVIAGGPVSAQLKDNTKKLCKEKKVYDSEIWSGNEFEERPRASAESLLKRFISGEVFPESPTDLSKFSEETLLQTDDEILTLMAGLFDRPAFYTPFHQESSIPAFKKAITDTIEALNTGIHRLRDGTVIRRIPSLHAIQSEKIKQQLSQIVSRLVELRSRYDEYIKTGEIRPCGCKVPDCPVFFVSPLAGREMDRMREEILSSFYSLCPGPHDTGWGMPRHWRY